MQNSQNDNVAQVLGANDIADVLGSYLQFTSSSGSSLKALCPFHAEKTPSFVVNRDRQNFHCFGCGKGGDVITFLQEHEGLTFPEALQSLADRAGITLAAYRGSGGNDNGRSEILALGKVAARFYREQLESPLKGSAGREYLETRHLRDETIKRFGLGYVPEQWNLLLDHAKSEDISSELVENAGLAKMGERGSRYDFFRNRLMIPIHDVAGNVVAFGGRDLGDSPAKYINSPENAVYKKSKVLYGLHEGRDAMRAAKRALLVEGYFDVLRCFDVGIEIAVASCGTALTPEQAKLIRRYVPEVVVVFDGDEAGIRAALKGISILCAAGLTVRALTLPDGKDPDDYIYEQGAEAFEKQVENAPDFVTFFVRENQHRTKTIEGRSEVAKEMFEIFATLDNELRRDEYVRLLATELGLDEGSCRREFSGFIRGQHRPSEAEPEDHREHAPPTYEDAIFLAHLLRDEKLIQLAKSKTQEIINSETPLGEVMEALFIQGALRGVQALESDGARALYTNAANIDEATLQGDSEAAVLERCNTLLRAAYHHESTRLQREIDMAQRSNETSNVFELVQKKASFDMRIDKLRTSLM